MKKLLLFSLCSLFIGCAHIKAPEKKQDILKVSWSKNLDPTYVSGNLPIGPGAPRIFNEIVYMGSLSGVMSAYDLETGRLLWSQQENTELGAPVEFFNDFIAYGGTNGRLFVRHYLTGELKYAIDLAAPIESAPVFFEDRLLLYLRGHQLVQLDAETGKVLWAYKRAVPVATTLQRTTKPLVLGNKIIVGFADGFLGALSVQEGILLWETKLAEGAKFVDVDLNPLFDSSTIITGSPSDELKAVNPDTGAISRSFGVSVMAHPVMKGSQLLLGTNDGEVLLMAMDGKILKRVKVSEQPVSAVVWWKDNIIAASFDGYLRVIDPLSFKAVEKFALGYDYSSVFSDLVVHDGYLAVYSSRNRLYLFQ
jgi:outer membrane protein assembly factor BamB